MLKTRKRWISLLLTLAMLVAFCVPFTGTAFAGAVTYNTVTSIPQFDPAGAGDIYTATVQVKLDPAIGQLSTAKVEVLAGDNSQLSIKEVKLEGASTTVDAVYVDDVARGSTDTVTFSPAVKSFKLGVLPDGTDKATVNIKVKVDANDCAAGDIKLNVFAPTGQFEAGSVVVARAASGAVTAALVGSAPKIGEDSSGKLVTIRLTENSVGAIKGTDAVKIKLPAGFIWTDVGLAPTTGSVRAAVYDRILTVSRVSADTTAGTYDISATVKVDDRDTAKKGDVVATIEGYNNTSITPSELTVAIYADYGVDLTVASVKELLAGRSSDQKTDKIKLEETIPGSLIGGRTITVKLPDWVKIVGKEVSSNSQFNTATINYKDNKLTVTAPSTTTDKAKLEFKLTLSIEANRSGDIEAVVSGAGITETKLVVAKAVPVVSVTGGSGDVKIGIQDQAAPDITITEAKAGALLQNGELKVVIPDAKFSVTPKVEVIDGDLEIKTESVKVDDDTLIIPIKSESVKAGTIKISGIKLTLDRTVPEGPLAAKIMGSAVLDNGGSSDNGKFLTDYAVKFVAANCVTPAPVDQKGTAVFKIGEKKYIVNGQEVEMDVAPIAEAGRTYLPARFVANAMGVPDANILWDQASKTVTVIRGERFVQMKVGSKQILVNGITLNMDVAPKVVPGRVLIPFRFLAQALGAEVVWDPADPNTIILNF